MCMDDKEHGLSVVIGYITSVFSPLYNSYQAAIPEIQELMVDCDG